MAPSSTYASSMGGSSRKVAGRPCLPQPASSREHAPATGAPPLPYSGSLSSSPRVPSIPSIITAPPKPSKQTQILLEAMATNGTEDKAHWEQLMENFDLLFSQVNDIGINQQQLRAQIDFNARTVDQYAQEQKLIAQQVKATGQAVPLLTMAQFDNDNSSINSSHSSLEQAEEILRHTLPKMQFPTFDGSHPRIWKDKCEDYFAMFDVPDHMWVRSATMHFQDNATKWLQAYKQKNKLENWGLFYTALETKFGADDYRVAITDLLALRQTDSVEAYTTAFEALQFEICMHNSTYDDLFFTSQYIASLKDDIRGVVEPQVPSTVEQASRIAKIQQRLLDRNRAKFGKSTKPSHVAGKADIKTTTPSTSFWKDRQLREYRRTNGLCYHCGDKFTPGHMETCAKKPTAQANALVLNDLDKEISEEVLNQIAIEEVLTEDFCNLSLNALAGTEGNECLKLRAIVNKKVLLMLIDSGSSHSFVSNAFVTKAGLIPQAAPSREVKVANGQVLTSDKVVLNMSWWCQGYTLTTDMRVLDIDAYDAILGLLVKLQGLSPAPFSLSSISGAQVSKWIKGNDVWALAVVDLPAPQPHQDLSDVTPAPVVKLLSNYQDIFHDPQTLPPVRAYDHHIPLYPDAVPVNFQKKDGSWRMCVDYRKLNAMTIKNRFPLPIIEEILDELGQAQYFTKLDMKSGYHQVRMHPDDEYKTAFKTHHGHYQFKVMPFGLTNAPATFQCIMNEVLSPFLRKFVLVFLDDILIFSKSLEDHVAHLQLVLDKLRDHQLYLKFSKCSFGQQSVDYLGHVISHEGVSTDPHKTAVMINWPRPTSMTELRAFLGLSGYYRRFVQHYGLIAKPLNLILRLKQFKWSEAAEQAFLQLKQAMVDTHVLAIPNFDLPFTIETDACETGIGVVLMQNVVQPVWLQEVLNSYTTDSRAQQLLAQLAVHSPSEEGYSIDNGLIKYKDKVWLGNNSAIQTKIIAALHSTPIGGHSGINTTYYRVKKLFAWKGLKSHVESFVKQCSVCQQAKHSTTHPAGLLQPLPIPNGAWQDISMDFIEGLPKSEGFNAILVVVDRFTKFAHFIAIKHPYTAQVIARCILDNVVRLHGLPKSIVSDRDPVFVSHFWQELFRLYDAKLNLSTAYHPQTDGQTERVNQSLKMYLRLYGHEPNLAAESSIASSTSSTVNDLLPERAIQLEFLKKHLSSAQNRMKQHADKNRSELEFQVGEKVLLKLQPYAQSSLINWPFPKLAFKYFGPYTVLERIGKVAYRLDLPDGSSIHPVFHVSQLKPFTADYSPVFSTLPAVPDLDGPSIQPATIVERRLVKRGTSAVPQVRIQWTGLSPSATTWEDYHVVRERFPTAAAWGQAPSSAGGVVTAGTADA
ncbi:hypothetical protein U9M48_026604 [Paspalum notatum var. saurae]|uniref:Uncharacterized protein n=1 Tax=Paspalum notatum var. saurae TaxID=547442 RepID=A0AAQ3TUV2_PASNO